jgi:hypothetical protein
VKTARQLKDSIILQVWPDGMPENLVTQIDEMFQEAFAEIAKWVDGERSKNANVVHACDTHFKCGMTVLEAPRGVIKRIYTVANAEYCDPVFYLNKDWPAPECWSRNLRNQATVDSDVPMLPLGFRPFDASTDTGFGRARSGIWSQHDGNIYISPWIQSNEYVVIEWEGIKENWADSDLVNPDQDYKKALRLYFQYCYESLYGDPAMAQSIHNIGKTGTFDEALADLMWYDREKRIQPIERGQECSPSACRLPSQIADDGVPDLTLEVDGMVVAHVGGLSLAETGGFVEVQRVPDDPGGLVTVINHGSTTFECNRFTFGVLSGAGQIAAGNTGSAFSINVGTVNAPWELKLDGVVVASGSYFHGYDWTYTIAAGSSTKIEDIAELVNTFDPGVIIGVDLITTDAYDDTVGLGFHDFLKPYTGAHGDEGDKNRFWPAVADSDYTSQVSLANYLAFFPIPLGAKYYTIQRGPIQFFFLDTNAAHEADGITATSIQAQWLMTELLRSQAAWKVVVMFKNPYSGNSQLSTVQWPFRNWGADLVLSSGAYNYERLLIGNLPFIVNGLATRSGVDANNTPVAGSQLFYNTGPGAGKITANGRELEYQFITLDGTVIDTLRLTK